MANNLDQPPASLHVSFRITVVCPVKLGPGIQTYKYNFNFKSQIYRALVVDTNACGIFVWCSDRQLVLCVDVGGPGVCAVTYEV